MTCDTTTISSRTPEGQPSKCVLCGAAADLDSSATGGDAPWPSCGQLLWASARLAQSIITHFEDALGVSPGAFNVNTRFSEEIPNLEADSLFGAIMLAILMIAGTAMGVAMGLYVAMQLDLTTTSVAIVSASLAGFQLVVHLRVPFIGMY